MVGTDDLSHGSNLRRKSGQPLILGNYRDLYSVEKIGSILRYMFPDYSQLIAINSYFILDKWSLCNEALCWLSFQLHICMLQLLVELHVWKYLIHSQSTRIWGLDGGGGVTGESGPWTTMLTFVRKWYNWFILSTHFHAGFTYYNH